MVVEPKEAPGAMTPGGHIKGVAGYRASYSVSAKPGKQEPGQ